MVWDAGTVMQEEGDDDAANADQEVPGRQLVLVPAETDAVIPAPLEGKPPLVPAHRCILQALAAPGPR